MFFIIEEAKEVILDFSEGTVKVWVDDIFSKDAWVIPLKNKRDITITNAFQKFLKESNCKPNKI